MGLTLPGYKLFEYTIPLTTAASPLVSPWIETTGFTTLLVSAVFATGTTVLTVEGSFDGSTLDTTMPYGAGITGAGTGVTGTLIVVQHTFVRFRIVQTVANATVTTAYAQSRQ